MILFPPFYEVQITNILNSFVSVIPSRYAHEVDLVMSLFCSGLTPQGRVVLIEINAKKFFIYLS